MADSQPCGLLGGLSRAALPWARHGLGCVGRRSDKQAPSHLRTTWRGEACALAWCPNSGQTPGKVNVSPLLRQIYGTSPTSAQTQAGVALVGARPDPRCRSPPTSRCSHYFCRWTARPGSGWVWRGGAIRDSRKVGLSSAGPGSLLHQGPHLWAPLEWSGSPLILPQGEASLAPPPKCCLQHPSSSNSHT